MRLKRIPMMILALIASICLWLYVVTVVDPNDTNSYSNIPVTLENVDQMQENGLMLTSGENATVSLKISGRRSELKKLSRDNITVTADVSRIQTEGTHELSYTVTLPDTVSMNSLTIEDRSPTRIAVIVEHYTQKEVDVRVVFEGEATQEQNGETLVIDTDSMQTDPQTVMVTGPQTLVDSIDFARVTINKAEITETTTQDYAFDLIDQDGNILDQEELVLDTQTISVRIPVRINKEVPLVLETVEGGGATDENVSYTLSTDTIVISGAASVIEGIDEISVGTLNYAEVTGSTTQTYPINLPDGVINVSGLAEVTATIRVSGLQMITMTVTNFHLLHVPEGLTATAISESLLLTLRGTPEDLAQLEPEDITVTVDLSTFTQAGTYIIPVSVSVSGGLQVGAIGGNSLTITLE